MCVCVYVLPINSTQETKDGKKYDEAKELEGDSYEQEMVVNDIKLEPNCIRGRWRAMSSRPTTTGCEKPRTSQKAVVQSESGLRKRKPRS